MRAGFQIFCLKEIIALKMLAISQLPLDEFRDWAGFLHPVKILSRPKTAVNLRVHVKRQSRLMRQPVLKQKDRKYYSQFGPKVCSTSHDFAFGFVTLPEERQPGKKPSQTYVDNSECFQ